MEDEYKFNDVPFNFVPLNHEVYIPEWGDQVSQDKPFKDGEDGIIRFTITNTTPMCVGGKRVKVEIDDNKVESDDYGEKSVVTQACVKVGNEKHYYIPATSIKGMLRSTLEILSFSKLQKKHQYNDNLFYYRDVANATVSKEIYAQQVRKDVHFGWLHKTPSNTYELADCGEWTEDDRILIGEIGEFDPELRKLYDKVSDKNAQEKAEFFEEQGYGYYPMIGGKHLVCSGEMDGKKHEQLFPPYRDLNSEFVSSDDVQSFKEAYIDSPYGTYIDKMLEGKTDGGTCDKNKREWLPVFFKFYAVDKSTKIGVTRLFRTPYGHKVSHGINQKDAKGGKLDGQRDFSETLFGFVDGKDASRGRVQFGNAFALSSEKQISLAEPAKGVLGSPKASFYPYYLQQTVQHVDYNSEEFEISGRKRYRIQSDKKVFSLPSGNGNEKTMTEIHPLPAGNDFNCEIRFHNLLPQEIGALLSALTFHNSQFCHHSIGMGKAFGFGKLNVSNLSLQYLNHDVLFYLRAFEVCMTKFTLNTPNIAKPWVETSQLKALCAIATEHEAELGYMDLNSDNEKGRKRPYKEHNTYAEARKIQNFTLLKKESVDVNTLLTDEDYLTLYAECHQIEKAITEEQYEMVKTLCTSLLAKRCLTQGVREQVKLWRNKAESEIQKQKDSVELELRKQRERFDSRVDAIKNLCIQKLWKQVESKCGEWLKDFDRQTKEIKEVLQNRAKEVDALQKRAIENIQKGKEGLAKVLNDRNVNGDLKVTKFSQVCDRVADWKKKQGSLSDEDKEAVKCKLKEIYDGVTKSADKKDFENYDKSRQWKILVKHVGEDVAQNWYAAVVNQQPTN